MFILCNIYTFKNNSQITNDNTIERRLYMEMTVLIKELYTFGSRCKTTVSYDTYEIQIIKMVKQLFMKIQLAIAQELPKVIFSNERRLKHFPDHDILTQDCNTLLLKFVSSIDFYLQLIYWTSLYSNDDFIVTQ